MKVLVMGPVVISDGVRIARFGERETALLAMLAANFAERVSTDALIDGIWPAGAPRTAAKTLQGHVHRLRAVLGQDTVEHRARGYVLLGDRVTLDADDMCRLIDRAADARRSADFDKAANLLREAIAISRGRPYEDVEIDSVVADARRLDDIRLRAFEELIDAELAGGRHREVIGELESYLTSNPMRERAWGQLMTALYRADRQAEALAAYARVRSVLGDELGLEPGPNLQALELAILRHDTALAPPREFNATPVSPRDRAKSFTPGTLAAPSARGMLVGRQGELAQCERDLESRRGGGRLLLTVSGPAGVGKSFLASAVATVAVANGWQVAATRCDERFGRPYGGVSKLIEGLIDGTGRDGLARLDLSAADSARIDRLVQHGRGDSSTTTPDTVDLELERTLTIEAFDRAFTAAARAVPLLLFVDDIQWADALSLVTLRRALSSDRAGALVIIGTWRDDAEPRAPELLDLTVAADRAAAHRRVPLGPLDDDGIAGLIEAVLGSPRPKLVSAFAERSGGNPLLAAGLLHAFAELESAGDAPDAASMLPRTIVDLVGARVARLTGAAQRLLEVGALMAAEIDVGVVANVLGESLVAAVDEVCASGLAAERRTPRPRLVFTHDLYRDVLRARRSAAWQVDMHRALATVLAASPSRDVDQWCFHASHSGDAVLAATALRHRARRSAQALLMDEALADLTEAARWMSQHDQLDDPLTAALHEAIGEVHGSMGAADDASASYDIALAFTPPEASSRRAEIYRKKGRCSRLGRRMTRAELALGEARRLCGDVVPTDAADRHVWMDVALERAWLGYARREGRDNEIGAAADLAGIIRAHGDISQRANVCHLLSLLQVRHTGYLDAEPARVWAREAMELAGQIGPGVRLAEARVGVGFIELFAGDLFEASRHLQDAKVLFESLGDRTWTEMCTMYLGVAARFGQDQAASADAACSVLQATRSPLPGVYLAAATGTMAWCALRRGDFDEARTLAGEALNTWQQPDQFYSLQAIGLWPAIAAADAVGDRSELPPLCQRLLGEHQLRYPSDVHADLSGVAGGGSPRLSAATTAWATQRGWM